MIAQNKIAAKALGFLRRVAGCIWRGVRWDVRVRPAAAVPAASGHLEIPQNINSSTKQKHIEMNMSHAKDICKVLIRRGKNLPDHFHFF